MESWTTLLTNAKWILGWSGFQCFGSLSGRLSFSLPTRYQCRVDPCPFCRVLIVSNVLEWGSPLLICDDYIYIYVLYENMCVCTCIIVGGSYSFKHEEWRCKTRDRVAAPHLLRPFVLAVARPKCPVAETSATTGRTAKHVIRRMLQSKVWQKHLPLPEERRSMSYVECCKAKCGRNICHYRKNGEACHT